MILLEGEEPSRGVRVAIAVATYVLALLMVSTFRYWSFKEIDFARRRPVETLLVVVLARDDRGHHARGLPVPASSAATRCRARRAGSWAAARPRPGGRRPARRAAGTRIEARRHRRRRRIPHEHVTRSRCCPATGSGQEVTAEAVRVLRAVGQGGRASFEFEQALVGGAAIDASGTPLPPDDAGALPGATPSCSARSAGPSGTTCRRSSGPSAACSACARSSTSTPTCARPPAFRCWWTPRRSSARWSRAPTSW